MMPSLFVAHGAPLLALQNNEYTKFLSDLGSAMPRPKAIVIFSAHWLARTQRVSVADTYDTIYDFGGFSDELYQIRYPAAGDAQVAKQVEDALSHNGIAFEVDGERGLDHGAWVVLRLLYPNADIPVVAMSVNPLLTPEEQYRIGQSLTALRQQDILVIGSGGTVHNLRAIQWDTEVPNDWAVAFDDWLSGELTAWNLASLFNYAEAAPHASLAVPPRGNEHFVPLLYAMGAADDVRTAKLLHRSYQYGNLSQSVWQFR